MWCFMALPVGTKLGPYEIVATLGSGGMGEVYRAHDSRLNRTVAIKVLPADLSADPERRKRLLHEARVISILSHPHICALYDIGQQDGTDFLVMEYLEGESLQARLEKGPLSLDLVLRHGQEIAEALGTAHRKGIVHRDLKPGNVMLTKSGAKLLDFGLARLVTRSGARASLDNLTAESTRLTQEGIILGTFQYMAPEQLEGKDADSRSDIFALGTILYEMTTGKPAFSGQNHATLIAAILASEPPPISTLRTMVPGSIDRFIQRCMEKDSEERWQSAKDAASELQWISQAISKPETSPVGRKGKAREGLTIAAALLAALAVFVLAFAYWGARPHRAAVVRLSLLPPEKTQFDHIVLAPDGRSLAFTVEGPKEKRGLWLRPLDSTTAQLLPGTEDAVNPFWSADSRSIGFFTEGKLKRVDASGGVPETLCSIPHLQDPEGAWNKDGIVLFGSQVYKEIQQISLTNCAIKPVTQIDNSLKEIGHTSSCFLPDGRHFLWVSHHLLPEMGLDIYASSIDSQTRLLVLHNASMPSYVAPGYLVFAREGKLMVQPFDATLLRTTGEPVPVVPERVAFDDFSGFAVYSVSQDGVLLYMPDTPIASQLQWWVRSGKAPENIAEPGFNRMLQISPEGSRVLVDRSSGIWIYEITQHIWNRFTFDGGLSEARWSPDGRQVFYTDRQGRVFSLLRKASDGSGAEETIWQSDQWLAPRSVSPNGRYLLYETYDAQQGFQLSQLTLSGNRQTTAFIQTQFNEGNATFSPNGGWVTYVSDKSGEYQIYVRPFPGPGEEWQVSSGIAAEVGGGSSIALKWRADGKEAFYLSADWQVMSVPVTTAPRFQTGVPRPLFAVPPGSQFDVTADGQRFLVNAPLQNSEAQPLNVVLNWNSSHASK